MELVESEGESQGGEGVNELIAVYARFCCTAVALGNRLRQMVADILCFDRVTKSGYHWTVKPSELRRWLKKQGCTFVEESRYTRIGLGSKISRMPRHPAKEIKTRTLQTILKDLGLKM